MQSTDQSLAHALIYSVFVRNHTSEGTFAALEADLDRIASLGCDFVWLMPIHPVGVAGRKGSAGSPYAITDYRATNPDFGSLDDFKHLVDAIHEQGMRCMIDVVYNHTSRDSVLLREHPEFFWQSPAGGPGNRIGDWSDVYDLDYSVDALWDYQIETLVNWAKIVDGFRCDVASFVPVTFWQKARAAVEEVHPGFVWLAESVHRSFNEASRAAGLICATDGELFDAFDIEYSYDIQEAFDAYLAGTISLAHYIDLVGLQITDLPTGALKARYLENHDLPRIAGRLALDTQRPLNLENLTTLSFMLPGPQLIYAGQEFAMTHTPSLFDPDPCKWPAQLTVTKTSDSTLSTTQATDLSDLMTSLSRLKHTTLTSCPTTCFTLATNNADALLITRTGTSTRVVAAVSLAGTPFEASCELPSGSYTCLLDGSTLTVTDGVLASDGKPHIIATDFKPAGFLTAIENNV